MNKSLQVTVLAKKQIFDLGFIVHESNSLENQRIESEFYVKWNDGIHTGIHHEIEILSPQLLDSKLYQRGMVSPSKLHIHRSKKFTDQYYVCWTGHLPNINVMLKIVNFWSVGSVYSLMHEKDFATMMNEQNLDPNDHPKFFQFMESKYNIVIRGSILLN